MSRQRFLVLLIAAVVALSAAGYLSTQRNPSHRAEERALLPSLAEDVNSVTAVILRRGGEAPVTVHRVGDRWTVAERDNYPADVSKLRALLGSLRDARIVEEKTSDPRRYTDIGVEDPAPGAASIEVTVVTQDATAPGTPTAGAPAARTATSGTAVSSVAASVAGSAKRYSVIVGKPVGAGNFVRRPGERRSYSVEPAISVETAPRFWIDPRVLDVQAALIQRIDAKPAGGAAYTLHRLNPADDTYGLDGVPAGRKAVDAAALAPTPTLLASLTADDVSPAANIDFGQSSQAVVTLLDGNVITLTGAAIGDKRWIEVKSSKDPALTAKAEGRAFEVANYRYDAIFKPLEQLLVPKELPAKALPGAPSNTAKKIKLAVPPRAPAS